MSSVVRELISLARDERIARAGVDIAAVVRSAAKFALTTIDVAIRCERVPEIETSAARSGRDQCAQQRTQVRLELPIHAPSDSPT